ncbi:MAG: hypothetical protein C0472_02560 [Erythrobacter sp.]|nr:hypothetical protein [Erythrobacter sp.]
MACLHKVGGHPATHVAEADKGDFHCLTPLPLAGGAGGGPARRKCMGVPTPDPSRKREGD